MILLARRDRRTTSWTPLTAEAVCAPVQPARHSRAAMGMGQALMVLLAVLLITGPAVSGPSARRALNTDDALGKAAASSLPAVVHVEAVKCEAAPLDPNGSTSSFLFEQLAGMAGTAAPILQDRKVLGTGIIIDTEAHVLTSRMLVIDASEIEVFMADGRRYRGALVGTDTRTDLAVIQIATADPLPHIDFSDSDALNAGQPVSALAYVRAGRPAVAYGLLLEKKSTEARLGQSERRFVKPAGMVNLAYCGSPLINVFGEVVGVNAGIISNTAGLIGIAFFIPGNAAQAIASRLISGRDTPDGLRQGSPRFLRAALTRRVALCDQRVLHASFRARSTTPAYGRVKTMTVSRGIQGDVPDNDIQSRAVCLDVPAVFAGPGFDRSMDTLPPDETGGISLQKRLGVEARPAGPEELSRFHLRGRQAMVVIWLDPAGPLARAGVEINDMMLEINGRRIKGPDHFVQLVSCTKPRKRVTILVLDHRTGRAGYIQVRTP